jgi:hypothetical protein
MKDLSLAMTARLEVQLLKVSFHSMEKLIAAWIRDGWEIP